MEHELTLRGIPFEAQKRLAVVYKDQIGGEYIADLVIDGKVILELKAVSALHPAHEAQAHHYLAATGLRLAILLNPSTGLCKAPPGTIIATGLWSRDGMGFQASSRVDAYLGPSAPTS